MQGCRWMERQFYIYILSNKNNTVLYIGITNDLVRRIYEHKNKLCKGFTKKYNVDKLVYYEICDDPISAIAREKQIKAGSRKKNISLVESMNVEWIDLYSLIVLI
jgi:putative endonuclease